MTRINWMDLDGVANMRDLGGLPTTDGSVIRHGRLVRSDNLQDLTPEAVEHLVTDLRLSDVVDLRSSHEVDAEGPGPLRSEPRVAHHHLSLLRERPGADAGADALLTRRGQEKFDENHWTSHYLGYLRARPESVVGALRVLARADGATIVHCAAGKDRTGTVVGLALSVAGVAPADIVADYAASAERIEAIIARLSARPTYAAVLRSGAAHQTPRAESMARFLDALDRTHGGALGWLDEQGWSDQETADLCGALRR
ncbi:tyrosine-protein phosphatase [Nocardioides sp. AE5]|uniref:tyrosine-protein phosphatase n=1 Tax=Nocardioides sp. AE5 TaxID=2962573 RepID=UPI00288150B0|nr:tyrosine-protein phosphatase [Nocardioides sp. AE5]MDT0203640.1 tyrosine-protein phosphatase [Nocardioides sp. AE5]